MALDDSNIKQMEFPTPPTSPDLNAMHKWTLSVYNVMKQVMLNGLQSPHFKQTQLDQMLDLSQSGKIFFNGKTGKFNGGEIDPITGNLVIKEFTTT